MSRNESIGLGTAMIAAAGTLLVLLHGIGMVVGWSLFVLGCAFVANPFRQDWRYGEFRPTRKEINKMLSDDYKEPLRDPKFRKWVDHLFPSGR